MTTNKFERFVINFCEERNAYIIKDRETNLLVVREDKETTYKTESLKEAYAFTLHLLEVFTDFCQHSQ